MNTKITEKELLELGFMQTISKDQTWYTYTFDNGNRLVIDLNESEFQLPWDDCNYCDINIDDIKKVINIQNLMLNLSTHN